MSIVPNVGEHVDIAGVVQVGTITGAVLYSAPYESSGGAPVARELLRSFEATWNALPEVLAAEGDGRFDLVVRQRHPSDAVLYWNSGLSAGALAGVVSRRLLKLRMQVHPASFAPVEVREVPDDGTVDWHPVDHTEQVRQQLHAIIHGVDPWAGAGG